VPGLVVVPFVLRYQRPQSTFGHKLSQVDWIGSITFMLGMTAFLVGISWGGSQYPWSSAATLVPLILGLFAVFSTGLYERFLARQTFLRLSLFNSWSAIAIYFCTVLQGLTLFVKVYFLGLYLLGVQSFSPLRTGAALCAFGIILIPSNVVTGAIIARVGSFRWAIWSGWAISTLSLGLFTLLDVDTPIQVWLPLFLVAGVGQGILFLAHSIASQAACEQKDAAHANCMYSFMRSLGLCVGVSLGGTIFQNLLRMRLVETNLSVEIAENAEAIAHLLRGMAASEEKTEIVAAYAWSFRMLFAVLCGVSAVGLLISITSIKAHSLNQEIDSQHMLRGEVREVKEVSEKAMAQLSAKEKEIAQMGIIDLGSWFPELPRM
jgi:hypothetical protein